MAPMPLTLQQFAQVCTRAPIERLAEVLGPYLAALPLAGATTPLREAMWLAEVAHETAEMRRFEENLSYSATRLCVVWPRRFPTFQAAAPYARSPEKLANKVYADRMGNGDEASGDGWKYRGRGALMTTGFDNYMACERATGIPFVAQPELAAVLEHAFTVGALWWRVHGCNAPADLGDVRGCRRIVNGGLVGIGQVEELYARCCAVLGVGPQLVA